MKQRAVSIEDIARAAGVSHSTVSRALRDSPLISLPVRERLQALAAEMGYIPNAIAQSLHNNKRTHTIGLVVRSLSDPFFAEVVKGVEEVARPAGFSVLLGASHNDPQQEEAMLENMHRRRVDGIVLADSQITAAALERQARAGVPAVLVNRQAQEPARDFPAVAVDDSLGITLAVEHLISLGHRAIGYLGLENRPFSNRQRREAYRQRLSDAGIAAAPEWEINIPAGGLPEDGEVEAGQASTARLLAAGVSAVCCYNDMLAVGVLNGCRELSRAVPGDLSLVGYDDLALAHYVSPALTTVHQPVLEMGRSAMQLLLELLKGRPAASCLLLPHLVVRGSTCSI